MKRPRALAAGLMAATSAFVLSATAKAEALAMVGPERAQLMDAARVPVVEKLKRDDVRFKVETLKVEGDWAFLVADMQDKAGRPIDYAGTPLAEPAREGFLSRTYAALLKREDGRWALKAHALGPTDVAWAEWDRAYGAPSTLIQP